MTKLGVFGATALSLSLIVATPVLAQEAHNGRAGMHAGAPHAGGARIGGAGPRVQSNFRGAQTNVGRSNFAGRGNAGNAQVAQGAYRGGEFRGDRGRGFGRDIAAGTVAAGVVTGSALALGRYGYYNGGYYDPNAYGDSYAYDEGSTYDTGLPLVTFDQQPAPVVVDQAMGGDAAYCAQRYRSYDPASGTYLGFDGLRHPCL
jgi:hypothetical protein